MLNNKRYLSKKDTSIHLLIRLSIRHLVRSSSFNGIKPQILRQVKQKARFISSFAQQLLTRRPSIWRIASDYLKVILAIAALIWIILLAVRHLQKYNICQSFLTIFGLLEGIEHVIQEIITLRWDISKILLEKKLWLYLFTDDGVEGQVEIKQRALDIVEDGGGDEIVFPDFYVFFFAREIFVELVVLGENSEDWALNWILDDWGNLNAFGCLIGYGGSFFFNHVEKLFDSTLDFLCLFLRRS